MYSLINVSVRNIVTPKNVIFNNFKMNHVFQDPAVITNSKYIVSWLWQYPTEAALDRKAC